jgi:hypothetical protein
MVYFQNYMVDNHVILYEFVLFEMYEFKHARLNSYKHVCSYVSNSMKLGDPVLKLAKKNAPNAIFRVVSCLYTLNDLTCSVWLKKTTHSHSYKAYRCFTMFFTSD